MMLQTEGTPDPRDRGLGQPGLCGHRPGRPVRGVLRRRLQGLDDHGLDLVVTDRARPARPRFVQQPIETIGDEP